MSAGVSGASHDPGAGPVPPPASRAGRAVPECHGDVCITCSDEAVTCRVLSVADDGLALVDTGQTVEEVSIALVDAAPGDLVLVHAKEAIARVADGGDAVAPVDSQPVDGREPAP